MLLVEHRMDVIKRLASHRRAAGRRDDRGRPPAEVVALPAVQQAYLGMQMGAKPQREAGHG